MSSNRDAKPDRPVPMSSNPNVCPCGLGRNLGECCGPFVRGDRLPSTPESLMRSRYTAFCLGTPEAVRYLVESHHPNFREPGLEVSLESASPGIRWTGLTIMEASTEGDAGIVEFIATYEHEGQRHQLQERSSFQCEGGRWLYTTGLLDPSQNGPPRD